jgi:hypothetical protein
MANIPIVLVLTDSLAFPRFEPEVVSYQETWVALLKRYFPQIDFVHCGRGGATIDDLFKHSAYYHWTMRPAMVLVQVGIVDCAPRALSIIEQQILQRLPIVGAMLLALIRKNASKLRRWRGMSYTSPTSYEAWIKKFECIFPNIHWIGILPADANYESRLEGISVAINHYNALLQRRKYISTADFASEMIMSDHHHLNVAGHHRLATLLAETIQRVVVDEYVELSVKSVSYEDNVVSASL